MTKQAISYASYTFTFNETTAGTVYYRTTYASDTTYANAASNVVNVTITAKR